MIVGTDSHAICRIAALAAMALVGVSLLPVEVWGQDSTGSPEAVSRVRAADAGSAALLREGLARSATFRSLVDVIERSDLILYVESRHIPRPGQLQLMAATPWCRYLHVAVRTPGLETERIAWLGHELWHASELALAPDVRDQSLLLEYYQRIGAGGRYDPTVETAGAQEAWTKVLHETRGSAQPQVLTAEEFE